MTSSARIRIVIAALVVATSLIPAFTAPASSQRPQALFEPPNVVLILLDDATMANVAGMPITQQLVADEGVTFTRNYSPFPVCCPARATILTGQYAHNHRVLDNIAPQGGFTKFDDSQTVATYLTDEYRTGLFGKYMNDNGTQDGYVPPGWDVFKMPVQHDTYQGVMGDMWINGVRKSFPDQEQTRLLSRQARVFMSQSVMAEAPFFAYVSVVAPHNGKPIDDYPEGPSLTPWVSPDYRNIAPRVLPDDPSINEADVSDKPAFVRDSPLLTDEQLAIAAERSAQRAESLMAVDAEVGRIVGRLDELGALDETYVIVASDNGYVLGEHRKEYGKSVAYEPSAHVPLIIRGPGLEPGTAYDRVTGLQDLAPTILAMTGQTGDQPTDLMDGMDLLGLADGTRSNRVQLIEIPMTAGVTDVQAQAGVAPSPAKVRALRTLDWRWRGYVTSSGLKYVETVQTDEVELYNLNTDPFELENVANDGFHDAKVAEMAATLTSLTDCAGRGCR